MGKYIVEYDRTKRISANTMITVKNTETNETCRFTKSSLTRGFPLEYD